MVTASSTDGQWGMPTSPSYSYFIKKATDTSYPSTASYTGTKYKLYLYRINTKY